MTEIINLHLVPDGITIKVKKGITLMNAIRQAGIDIISPCGGKGSCDKCFVYITNHSLSGNRRKCLACQTLVESDLTVEIPEQSRFIEQSFDVQAVLKEEPAGTVRSNGDKGILETGLAIDVGTSRIAMYFINMSSGTTTNVAGRTNPQVQYGNDIITRLEFANADPDNKLLLQQIVFRAINEMIGAFCSEAGEKVEQSISNITIVGNTAMHHILAGADLDGIIRAPFTLSVNTNMFLQPEDIGVTNAPNASILLPPPISGHIGSDHLAVLLATGINNLSFPLMVVDVGTNTEISLVLEDTILSASCASGGAFEGSHISCGMQAARGAIDHISITEDIVSYHTIDKAKPVGICGSGIFDLMAELVKNSIVDKTGRLMKGHSRVRDEKPECEFVVVEEIELATEKIVITQNDIRALQLAKAAINAGMRILMLKAGIKASDLKKIIVAGSFGNYMSIDSAVQIGLFPEIPVERYHQVGNAAGIGAKNILLANNRDALIHGLMKKIRYVELVKFPDFRKIFMSSLLLGKQA